jgi:hypothetical protein
MVECPVCLRDVEIPPDAKDGDLIQCPVCKLTFKLVRVGDRWEGERVERQGTR